MPLLPSDTKTLIFTHGAGGTLSAPAVVDFCSGVSVTNTVTVLAFQGSMNLGSRVKGFRACVEYVEGEREEGRKKSGGKRAQASGLLVGGRSMGARAAVMAVLEKKEEKEKEKEGGVDLVLVSYPLKGPKDVRDQILLDLPASVNVLFIIGEKDAMCPLDLLNHVRNSMKAKTQLVVVKGADHGMKGGGVKLEKERGEETGRVAVKWLSGELKEDITYIGDEE
jgi:predicted alpha/beta-hydrolase family hydrolase